MGSRNNDNVVAIFVCGLVALSVGGVWAFSTFFGLDMATGLAVLLRMALLLSVVFVCWKFGQEVEFIHLSKSWPLLLALLWVCWWPALNFWAFQQSPGSWGADEAIFWWNAWYTKFGVLLAGVVAYLMTIKREY